MCRHSSLLESSDLDIQEQLTVDPLTISHLVISPSSAYTVSGMPVKVNLEIYQNYRLYAYQNLTIASRTV
jgi:hypothetical protein